MGLFLRDFIGINWCLEFHIDPTFELYAKKYMPKIVVVDVVVGKFCVVVDIR